MTKCKHNWYPVRAYLTETSSPTLLMHLIGDRRIKGTIDWVCRKCGAVIETNFNKIPKGKK